MTYTPSPPPNELSIRTVWDEFEKLRAFVESMQIDYISFRIHNTAPSKPKEGRAYYADGTNWNPGSGKGLYVYESSAWVQLSLSSITDNGDANAITIDSSENVAFSQNISLPDNKQLRLGNLAAGDLTLTHNGTKSIIDNNTGDLSIIIPAGNRFEVDSNTTTVFRIDDSSTSGDVRLYVYDVDNGVLERVTVGAADSGGAGFKVLRIPN